MLECPKERTADCRMRAPLNTGDVSIVHIVQKHINAALLVRRQFEDRRISELHDAGGCEERED